MSQDKKPEEQPKKCDLCGAKLTGIEAIAHMLVAHGPLVSPGRRCPELVEGKKRRAKVVAMLPRLHRRLEQMGYGEGQAHRILQAVAEELRNLGMV